MLKKALRPVRNVAATMLALWQLRHDARSIRRFQRRWEDGFYRAPGVWYQQDLSHFADLVKEVPGAFAEIGVRYGKCFRLLVPLAQAQSKSIYAIDSFEGTKQVCHLDGRPDGDMSIGGAEVFFAEMQHAGFSREKFQTAIGWIPDVFQQLPAAITFSFVILDVDNYTPTIDSLAYVWPRLSPGGLLLMDDFITPVQNDASHAIREFLRDNNDYWIERILPNYQIVLRKQR
jgi:hypothetical protein